MRIKWHVCCEKQSPAGPQMITQAPIGHLQGMLKNGAKLVITATPRPLKAGEVLHPGRLADRSAPHTRRVHGLGLLINCF